MTQPIENSTVFEKLTSIDQWVIFFFLTLFLLLPRFIKKNEPSDTDQGYILMNRGLTLPLFVATLTSTWYGGIFGVTQIAFERGIYSLVSQGIFWYFSYFLFAVFLAKKIRQKQILSLPELIGTKFGKRARRYAAFMLFFHSLPLSYAMSIGILFDMIFNIGFFWALVLGVLVVAVYTAFGGFRGVVLTDCLQFFLMFAAVITVTIFCFYRFGGLPFLVSSLPPSYFVWHGDKHMSSAIIWLFIACTSTFIHPVFYQRCLAAKSDAVAIGGIFIAMAFWLIFDLCTTLGGMYARASFPTAQSATAYLSLGIDILPRGLRGFFVSGLIATILSTLDSFMFVAGSSISYDLFAKDKVNTSWSHPLAILFCAFLMIAIGGFFPNRFEPMWLFMEGLFSSAILIPVLASVLIKKPLGEINFLLPALGAPMVFFIATAFKHLYGLVIEPFYLAHSASLVLFLIALNIDSKSKAKGAYLTDG